MGLPAAQLAEFGTLESKNFAPSNSLFCSELFFFGPFDGRIILGHLLGVRIRRRSGISWFTNLFDLVNYLFIGDQTNCMEVPTLSNELPENTLLQMQLEKKDG